MARQKNIEKILKAGGIGILPTDTLYGLVGQALNKKTVERISRVKIRPEKKPYIILLANQKDLVLFGVELTAQEKNILAEVWPGPISIIFKTKKPGLNYLHHGSKTLAFRWPNKKSLTNLIKQTSPLVAPSANPSGKPPAETITEAKKYFNNQVDFYCSGKTSSKPSSIISLENNKIKIIREGSGIKKLNKSENRPTVEN